MIKEMSISEALSKYPSIRLSVPKEVLRELTKDKEYLCRIDEAGQVVRSIEFGYKADDWVLQL